MNMSMAAMGKTGTSLFCSKDRNLSWYFWGIHFLFPTAGIARYWPVRGGDSPSSRAMSVSTAVMLPPAEVPPTMNPCEGSAFSDFAFAAAHFRASQLSFGAAGKGCSGASLYDAETQTAPNAWTMFLHVCSSPSGLPIQNPPPSTGQT